MSGLHTGQNTLSDDARTLLFYPDEPFEYGETVTVAIGSGLRTAGGDPIRDTVYRFSTVERELTAEEYAAAEADRYPAPPVRHPALPGGTYHTHPEFQNIMTALVTTSPQNTAAGYLFINAMGNVSPVNMILEESGEPIYIGLATAGEFVADLKIVSYQGVDHLAFHSGLFEGSWSRGTAFVMDNAYTIVDSWTIENGYNADFHEFIILDNGHVLLLGYLPTPFDLSPYGGPANGVVYDNVIQLQDTDKNVLFEWHGIDHFDPLDSYVNLANSPSDYIHANAIEMDLDGNLLLSSRHLSEITKIDLSTGDIIWRLGGKNNEFTFTNDIGFSYQHDIRRLANGNISLFDNGNQHSPPHSRAVEYALDEVGMTVNLVWKYPADTSLFGPFMGNMQRLDNGNTLIGWGGLPMFTEALADGTKTYEVEMTDMTYRAFRSEWSAIPAHDPRVALVYSSSTLTTTVYTSWNGATDITGYQVFAGADPGSMSLVTTAPRTGFETMVPLTGLAPDTCVFQVRPVHTDAIPMPYSNLAYRLDQFDCLQLLDLQFFPFIENE
ncbi:MAG TPA: arylsulfotransferase family protein [Anaerolineales bacterium]|nr:arylsulfotransferase family protein [Anaerolineales bacterium]